MIIDIHGHTVAPNEVYVFQSRLIASSGSTVKPPQISDELIHEYLKRHIEILDSVGTDIQLVSPRPFHMMHSMKPARIVRTWNCFMNDIIARQVALYPDRLRGVAGLPQVHGEGLEACIEELERCVKELGFVGCIINPDPAEGKYPEPPGLGDEYWYPLYEKLVELDVPALIHSAGCCSERESYTLHFINEESIAILSLLESKVFEDFPNLKLIICHGGGAIPYQIGRFRSIRFRNGEEEFDKDLKKLFYDTCLYSKDSLELLFKTVGTDRVLFGTEKPGTGSGVDPKTGRALDDLKPVINSIEWLGEKEKQDIFENNARKLFRL